MISTKEFIGKFKLDQENYEFNREDFLKELNNYFLELLEKNHIGANSKSPRWGLFKQTLKMVEKKFWSISNKKVGKPFSKDLWSAFYAVYVVPKRAQCFPEIELEIKNKRAQYKKGS